MGSLYAETPGFQKSMNSAKGSEHVEFPFGILKIGMSFVRFYNIICVYFEQRVAISLMWHRKISGLL
jgi:hypothetical protein